MESTIVPKNLEIANLVFFILRITEKAEQTHINFKKSIYNQFIKMRPKSILSFFTLYI